MKECRYCKKLINEENMICNFCGYDHQAGTLNPVFNSEGNLAKTEKQNANRGSFLNTIQGCFSVSPKIKGFAVFGIVTVILSLFFKHNFSFSGVLSEFNLAAFGKNKIKIARVNPDKKQNGQPEKIELRDVRLYEGNTRQINKNSLDIEGIFFDPSNKSFVTINGKVFSEGQGTGDIIIKKINKDSVEVLIAGENRVLKISKEKGVLEPMQSLAK